MAEDVSRVVLVTGGASGIGRATALRFAGEGARVAIWDVRDPDVGLQRLLCAEDRRWRFDRVDVTSTDGVERGMADLIRDWGRVDVLVNNAGIIRDAQLVRWKSGAPAGFMSDADFGAVLDVNLWGVFRCTRAAVPHMIRHGGGVVLAATSVVAGHGNFGQTNYVASKTAVIGMVQTWARELGRHNIRVNAVAPGFIRTEMSASIPQSVLETMTTRTPLGRLGDPADIAEAYVWLASDRARFVHGAVLAVDGGLVIGTQP